MPLISRIRAWRAAPVALALMAGAIAPAPAAAKTTPTFYATSSSSTTVGLSIFDHTNLSGATSPTGTITFKLFAPGDTGCSSPLFTTTVAVSGTGSDDSSRYATAMAGTYNWIAAYSGDASNNPIATACGDPSEAVIVGKAGPVEATSVTVNAGVIHATATLRYGFAPLTGTVTFQITGPNDAFCSGPVLYTSTVAVHGAGSYDSGGFTPTVAGTYKTIIRYNGDSNNYGISPTPCLDPPAAITLTQAQLASSATQPPATGEGGTTPPTTGGGSITPPSTGGRTVTPPAKGGGSIPPPTTGGGSIPPPTTGGGSVTPPSTAGGFTTPPSTGGAPGPTSPAVSPAITSQPPTPPATAAAPATTPQPPVPNAAAVAPPAHPQAAPASRRMAFDGPARCVRGPFTVSVAGAGVRAVTYLLQGRTARTVTRGDSRGRFRATVNPHGLRKGIRQQLTAKVAGANAAVVLHRGFTVCG